MQMSEYNNKSDRVSSVEQLDQYFKENVKRYHKKRKHLQKHILIISCSVQICHKKLGIFWPPFKQVAQFERVVKNHSSADDNWKLYPIARCFFSCDDYEKTRSKIKQAEISSDIHTDVEDVPPKQRKRSQPRRLSYGSSDDEDTVTNLTTFERPPHPCVKKVGVDFSSSTLIGQHFDVWLPCSSSLSVTSIIDTASDEGTTNTVFQKKLFTVLHQIKEQNRKITEQNTKIIDLLSKNNATANVVIGCKPENMPVELPVSNQESVNSLENYLQNKKSFSALSSYLSTLGGRDLTTKINRILKTVLDDTIASSYSFYGKRLNQSPFCDLFLKKATVDAIKANSPNSYEKESKRFYKNMA